MTRLLGLCVGRVLRVVDHQRMPTGAAHPASIVTTALSRANRRLRVELQYRFTLLLKALLTQPMGWVGRLHAWLQDVGERSTIHGVQHVAFLFCGPVFGLHQLLFKFTAELLFQGCHPRFQPGVAHQETPCQLDGFEQRAELHAGESTTAALDRLERAELAAEKARQRVLGGAA